MSALVELRESQSRWEPPPVKQLDEAVWDAWVAKGQTEDRRNSDALLKAVKYVSIAVLLVAAALGASLAPYEVVVRFIVALGATIVAVQTFSKRHYILAVVFGALALLYNPVAPVFSLATDWERTLIVISAVPFVVSLMWRNVRLAQDD